ncbi:hypothetical protein [Thiohalophilus thiocyanatoxydans]|uniref:Uncharacterized protein n=1 Tax=Thiohalophilus thiocyanatoxydans TaxID=381308 RepID=A0A4R8IMM9_9GAMM|nr:hypothetical protein [Thiohalophilus thiocyanatoxydans]TDY01698.1 hypothetical protein EDC23_1588 [Thiohalophilus thiocyanatoxydans]
MKGIITVSLFLLTLLARAGDVQILQVELQEETGKNWRAHVTLEHADTGWDHYADAWRVVSPDGKELGQRTLHHPHENEQPFTRSLSGIAIPGEMTVVVVEAHDKLHGWSADRVRIDLQQQSGDRYRVERR